MDDNTLFSCTFQARIQDLMLELMEKYLGDFQSNSSSLSSKTAILSDGVTTQSNTRFSDLIQQAAEKYNIEPELVKAVIQTESNFDPFAVSSCGAQGLMQLMPETAGDLGVTNALDPSQNIDAGTHLLRTLMNRYDDNLQLALAAYNAGPGKVDEYDGIPPITQTQIYVQRVMDLYRSNLG